MLTILAPAKLNLTLEVLSERRDGFHEIRSVVQTINLCDSLHLQPSSNVEFTCDIPDWIPEKSLISKAVSLLQKTTGCTKGAIIEIEKRIPLMSGLGGDSSDAAAILSGLNGLWKLGLSLENLLELAAKLGSDAAFFIYGGTASVRGRGDEVTPLPSLPHSWVVLMLPPMPRIEGKTGRLYSSLNSSHYTTGQITDNLVAWLMGRREEIPTKLFNVFDGVAPNYFSGLEKYWQQSLKAGAQEVHLAGSGPAMFTLTKDKILARQIYLYLQQWKLESYLIDTLTAKEQ